MDEEKGLIVCCPQCGSANISPRVGYGGISTTVDCGDCAYFGLPVEITPVGRQAIIKRFNATGPKQKAWLFTGKKRIAALALFIAIVLLFVYAVVYFWLSSPVKF
ncbi:MAG: hypothetical protein PHD95_03655 [Candidatus ainarchaeum sp.]|nr:hypothetical protein [Candidatus ainarchaeum sp.]